MGVGPAAWRWGALAVESWVPTSSSVALGVSPSLSFLIYRMETVAFNSEAGREDRMPAESLAWRTALVKKLLPSIMMVMCEVDGGGGKHSKDLKRGCLGKTQRRWAAIGAQLLGMEGVRTSLGKKGIILLCMQDQLRACELRLQGKLGKLRAGRQAGARRRRP